MSEFVRPVPKDQVAVESTRTRITRKYLLPLAITFSLGLAAAATTGEVISLIKWDQIAESKRERYGDTADELNDGVWPDGEDIGLGGAATGGIVLAGVSYLGKRRLDQEASGKASRS